MSFLFQDAKTSCDGFFGKCLYSVFYVYLFFPNWEDLTFSLARLQRKTKMTL